MRAVFKKQTLTFLAGAVGALFLRSVVAQESLPVEPVAVLFTSGQGVKVFDSGYGSGLARHPSEAGVYYLLTDRGPNFNGDSSGARVFPVPGYTPQIGIFRRVEGSLVRESVIEIKDSAGHSVSGLPNPAGLGGTGETPMDWDGNELALDEDGLDPEGLVALPDGTFWIGEEYGPRLVHVDAQGRTMERVTPFGNGDGERRLPKVFANRRPNRSLEGLAITSDGSALVGIMESALDNPVEARAIIRANSRATRIVLFHIETGATQQFVYFQEAPNLSNSEIQAVSNHEFIVLERDDRFPGDLSNPAVYKRFYRIDTAGATDISDPEDGELGLTFEIEGETKTIEQMSVLEILEAGIVPVRKELYLDLLAELPNAYGHDKPEGFSVLEDGRLEVVNDDEFGIASDGNGGLAQKSLPQSGQTDRNVLYTVAPPEIEGFPLQVLHASNHESAFQDPNTLEPKLLNYGAVLGGLKLLAEREKIPSLYVAAGDQTLPGPFYQASAQVDSLGWQGLADIRFFNATGLTATSIGDHEFNGGDHGMLDGFARRLRLAKYPFLAVNLDFSKVRLSEGVPDVEIGEDAANIEASQGKVAKSVWVEVNGERVGLIGRAPSDLFDITLNPEANLPGLDFVGGRHPETNWPLEPAIPQILEQVDLLKARGVNKIILLDHPLNFSGDPVPASELRDVDIIVFAGNTDFMAKAKPEGPFNLLRPDDKPAVDYPVLRADAEGNPVCVVNSGQNYRYVGHLIVTFDDQGLITQIDDRSGPIASTAEAVAALSEELLVPTLQAPQELRSTFEALAKTPLIQDLFTIVGTTSSPLNGAEDEIRSRETNLGRLVADSYLWWARRYVQLEGNAASVDIALKNSGGVRNSILGPNITKFSIESALAFDNALEIIELSGNELLAALENSVSHFPARSGSFPQIAGLNFEFDPRRPGVADALTLDIPSRVIHLTVRRENGTLVPLIENFQVVGDLSQRFVLAANEFLASGGDGYRAFGAAKSNPERLNLQTQIGERQVLSEYIQNVLGKEVHLSDDLANPRVRVFNELGKFARFKKDSPDGGVDEGVAYDPSTKRLFVTALSINGILVLDLSNPASPSLEFSIPILGGAANDIVAANGIVAVGIFNKIPGQNGFVVFLDAQSGTELNRVQVGVQPNMITFSPDGTKLLTANEGEPLEEYAIDPLGSVSIVDLSSGSLDDVAQLTQSQVTTIDFTSFNSAKDTLQEEGIRIFGQVHNQSGEFLRPSTVAEDLEPEYIAVTPDSRWAYVTMQENNAAAVLDLATMKLTNLFSLGFKDHSVEGQGLDASDRDGAVNIKTWPVMGMYQPDAIAAYETLGRTYIVGANEGAHRSIEQVRVKHLTLDTASYPNAETLQADENLGRLKTTTATGDFDGDGDIDQIFSYGARSFSIWGKFGKLVFDSGEDFERITAEVLGEHFNANSWDGSFDERSDDRGAEPEALAIGKIDNRIYAFIGLERVGGIMMYDITSPHSAFFVRYLNTTDFSAEDISQAGDVSPDAITFISADQSPSGEPLLVVAHEGSGTITVHTVRVAAPAEYKLQVIHSSDNESAFQNPNTLEPTILNYGAVLNGLQSLAAKEGIPSIYLTAGNHILPGPFDEASAHAGFGAEGLADIAFYNAMGLTANGTSNHGFDGGINAFAHMLRAADYPFLAVNLDFSKVEAAENAPAIEIGRDGASVAENAGKVAKSAWVEAGGEKIGLIGRAPLDFFNWLEDSALPGLDFVGGRDPETNLPLEDTVDMVLSQVRLLESQGINKIILLDHAQDFASDPHSTENLRGIDIIVAAAASGFLARPEANGPFNLLRPGDAASADYPIMRKDSEGNPVVVVHSGQNYRYVGNLIVHFDAAGRVRAVDDRSGPVASTPEAIAALQTELAGRIETPEVAATAEVREIFDALRNADSIIEQFQVVGETTTELVAATAEVRTRETNLGQLATDSILWFARRYLESQGSELSVDIALNNSGGIRRGIQGPSIIRLSINTALAFNNRLAIAELTAAEVIATFENSVSRYPAADGRFLQAAGIFLEYDPSRPSVESSPRLEIPSRVKNLTIFRADGAKDVIVADFEAQGDLQRTFGLVVNDFLMAGGDGYASLAAVNDDPNREVLLTETTEPQILADYIVEVLDGLVDIPEPLVSPRIVRFEILESRLLSASASAESVSFTFLLADGRKFALQTSSSAVSGPWTALNEGADFQTSSEDNGDGSVNLTMTLPNDGEQTFFRLMLLE